MSRRTTAMLKFFHRTGLLEADAILQQGFVDAVDYYLTSSLHFGVWLSDQPLDSNEGTEGEALLEIEIDSDYPALDLYEWIEEGKGYREWLIPASILNVSTSSIRLVDNIELDEE
jgi:hypothetical protein